MFCHLDFRCYFEANGQNHIHLRLIQFLKNSLHDIFSLSHHLLARWNLYIPRGRYSHTLPIRVCAAQRGRDFEAPGLARGIHFRRGF